MAVHFNFEPKPIDPIGSAAKIVGKDLIFTDSLEPRKGVSGYLTGYSDKASDYDFTVEDTNSKVAVRQTSDSPLALPLLLVDSHSGYALKDTFT